MIGKPGLPSRAVAVPRGANDAFAFLVSIGAPSGPEDTRTLIAQLIDATVAYDAATTAAKAAVDEASKAIDAADAAEQRARQVQRQTEADCAKAREALAADQARLADTFTDHSDKVRADTEALAAREAAVAEREAAAKRAAADCAASSEQLEKGLSVLAAREAAVQEREAAMDAREQRLKAALG